MLQRWWPTRVATTSGGELTAYWAIDAVALARALRSSPQGLSSAEAAARLARHGPNALDAAPDVTRLGALARQFRSPLLLILLFAAAAALIGGEWADAGIVLVIVVMSTGLAALREHAAGTAAAALRRDVQTRVRVLRDGHAGAIPMADVVPGDVVLLAAGSLVPADAVVLHAADCVVNEAVLTGETFPVGKRAGTSPAPAALRDRDNVVLMGTDVRGGTATCLVVHTGCDTQFGRLAGRLRLPAPETEFDRGLRHFGYLLATVMFVMVLAVFTLHAATGRATVETVLFAVALAVGLSPELLPAILAVNLARGAAAMAARGVLVRRLPAIENLGSMDILCTDKTGTLTEGIVELEGAYDEHGAPAPGVLALGALNASLGTGLAGALDEAIVRASGATVPTVRKLAELPFDFSRKRASIIVDDGDGEVTLVTKGAFTGVLAACVALADGTPIGADERTALTARYDAWSRQGIRVLAVATRRLDRRATYGRGDEQALTFRGFLAFFDRPKTEARDTLAALAALGVATKVITGDSRLVAQHVASLVGLEAARTLTGAELNALDDAALRHRAEHTDLFVEVDPHQKERIILALRKTGHVVGFLGDGVNDAAAMHAADTSLSVDSAVDVARAAADFVLLRPDLAVIRCGIEEGRRTFANTLKYVLTTTSANLGNMMSMAAASVVLPFLPLLAGQVLLNNFLSDIPALGLAGDSVDHELVDRPRRWDMTLIGRFMVEFGLISSVFDLVTFALLLVVFAAGVETFRTAWFVESLLTELLVALVVRTRRPLYRSRPGTALLVSTVVLVPLALALPYVPAAGALGFVPLPPALLTAVVLVAVGYAVATEGLKRWFFREDSDHDRTDHRLRRSHA